MLSCTWREPCSTRVRRPGARSTVASGLGKVVFEYSTRLRRQWRGLRIMIGRIEWSRLLLEECSVLNLGYSGRETSCSGSKSSVDSMSVLSRLFVKLIGFYQLFLSPLNTFHGPNAGCRYQPTCSNYAIECFKEHRFLTFWLATRRSLVPSVGGFECDPAQGIWKACGTKNRKP